MSEVLNPELFTEKPDRIVIEELGDLSVSSTVLPAGNLFYGDIDCNTPASGYRDGYYEDFI